MHTVHAPLGWPVKLHRAQQAIPISLRTPVALEMEMDLYHFAFLGIVYPLKKIFQENLLVHVCITYLVLIASILLLIRALLLYDYKVIFD